MSDGFSTQPLRPLEGLEAVNYQRVDLLSLLTGGQSTGVAAFVIYRVDIFIHDRPACLTQVQFS